jgi:hypothetical protein
MAITGTMAISDEQVEGIYRQCFGNLKGYSQYAGMNGRSGAMVDLRSEDQILGSTFNAGLKAAGYPGLKAMNVAGMGAGTADKAIIPIYLDPQIIDTSRKFTPAVEIIPRVSNMGVTAEYTTLSKGSAFTAVEDAALADVNDTYTRHSTAIKYLYAVGRVTGPTLAATPSFMLMGITASGGNPDGTFGNSSAPNATQLEVLAKTREIKELEENLIFNGNATTSGVTGDPDGTEYSGIVTLMSTTNAVVKGTAPLGLADLNLSIRYAFDDGGRPNVGFCSSDVYNDILALLQARVGYMQAEKQVFWGFTSITYRSMVGDIPIVPSMFMSNTTGSKAIYFLDLSVVEMRVLQDLTYERLAKVNDSDKFFLKIYEALIIKNTNFCSSVTGISA